MITTTTLRHALPIVLVASIALSAQAQHVTCIRQDHVHGGNDRGTSVVSIEVPPGFSFLSSLYLWTDIPAGTGSTAIPADYAFQDGTPVDWIDDSQSFSSEGPGSFDCASPIMITIPINTPTQTGSYEAVLVDNNSNYDPILIQLLVVEEPSYVDFLIQDTVFVDEAAIRPGTASGVGMDVACLLDYFPADSIQYNYMYYPPMPWGSQTPMDLMVAAGEEAGVELAIQSSVPGDFATYRYRGASWYTLPQILRYELHVELSTGMPHASSLPGLESMVFYPNPADQVSNIKIAMNTSANGYLVITDAAGREVLREACALRAGENSLTVRTAALPTGIYGCSLVVPGIGSTVARRLQVVR